jgi:chromosome segregation ATPase
VFDCTICLICKLLQQCVCHFLAHHCYICFNHLPLSLHPQVSTVYNKAIATSNTELIANSVIVLFVMELDEWIFSVLEAINKKWTEHAAKSEMEEAKKGAKIEEMREEIALHKAQIESQQEQIASQQEQFTLQQEELRKLREIVEKLQESQAAVAAATTSTTKSDSQSFSAYEDDTNARQMEQVDQILTPCEMVKNIRESQAAVAATPNIERKSGGRFARMSS